MSSSAITRGRAILEQLRTAVQSDENKAKSLLTQFKLALTEFPSQQDGSAPSGEEAAVAREGLEYGVILATRTGDAKAFTRNVQQLRPYYAASSAAEAPAAADARRQVLGLYLLHLLVDNSLPQFHSEVELLSPADKQSRFISFVLELENSLSEGAYNRILSSASSASSSSSAMPSPFYAPFVARLADTAREDIADCAAASYKSLSLAAAQKLFMLSSKEELLRFLRERRPDFVVSGDTLLFGESGIAGFEKSKGELDPLGLLGTTLEYAADLERIV